MGLIERAKNILLTPKTEWDVVAAEKTPTAALITGYVLPLAAVAALAGFIGMSFVSSLFGAKIGILWGLGMFAFNLVMAVVSVFIVGLIIDALAPSFGGQKDNDQALKAAAYTYTPVWVAGIAGIIPVLGGLVMLLGAIYAIYLLYLGLPKLMKNPEDKTVGYTAVVIIVAIVVSVIISAIAGFMMSGAMLGGAMMSGSMMGSRSGSSVTFDKDSAMGKLEDFSKKMEAAGRKVEDAAKSGDPSKQAAAAMEALGTALGGGKRVEPVGIEDLKPLMPGSFAGLARTSEKAQRSGVAAMMVTKAEVTYGGGEQRVRLEITDAGGATGLLGMASWMGAISEKEDENGRERTRKEGSRMVHEKTSRSGKRNKYSVVVAERFVVSAEGRGVELDALRAGVNAMDLGKLESMKSVGVQN